MNRKHFFIFLFFLLPFPLVFAQQHINFDHLTDEDGLSQGSVTCILQDKRGFMWFGTQDGLNRYDGYNFKIFRNIPSDSSTLLNNFIFSICEDRSGTLYIETQGGDWHRYLPKTESFKNINFTQVPVEQANLNSVDAVLYESGGIQWRGGLGKGTGLQRTDTKTGRIISYKHDSDNPSSLSDDRVYSVYRDRSGKLWVGTYNGLDRLDEESGHFVHYRNNPDNPNSLSDNWVWPVFEDSHGHLWIGTVQGGLSRYDPNSGNFTNFKNNPNDPTSINNNFIFSIYEDRSGVMWIGTNSGGINVFHPSTNTFEYYKKEPDNKNSLNDNLVASMLVDRNGIYWIGTQNGGLNRFDYEKKKFTSYQNNPDKPNSLTSNAVQSLLEDEDGILWVGTFSSGLNAFDRRTGKFTHFLHDPSDPGSLSDNRIYALLEGKDDQIWIGTYAGGLNLLNKNTGRIIHYQHQEQDSTTLSSNSTWSLALDRNENLWVGTYGGGINVFNKKQEIFSRFKNDPADSTSIIDDKIYRIFRDSQGRMWFGTTKGLSCYLPGSNSFRNYDEQDGLANSSVFGIVEDHKGSLWLSTNNGLSRFNPENESFKNYYYEDGLQGNEFNQSAFARDNKRGNLLFGGPNGFNVFNPDSLKPNSYIPPIEFTGFTRYNTDDEEGKPIIEKGISARDSIFLTYKDNIITFSFSALSFYNNLNNQYRYYLQGFNDNWIQLGNAHSVTFTNLSPGAYMLRVLGSNNDGLWNEQGASLNIQVSPPWWRTDLAYVLYFFTIFGLLYGVRSVELKRREQKAQIRESALRIKATEAEKRALEIENERKTKELEEARQLQLSMLPKELPEVPDLEIAAFMRTATEVGGDYYDFMVQDDGVLNIAFGDATGHGLQAGTMVTLMKGFFTSDSTKLGLQDFMKHCTRVIKEIKLGRILMSFSYLKIHDKKLHLTSAGMPPVYFHHHKTGQLEEIIIQGTPLGAMKNANYKTDERDLHSGDTILLLTDGLPEQMNGNDEMFDYSRVKKHFDENISQSPNIIIEKLIEAGDEWMNGRAQDDDISFVVIRVK